MFAIVINCPKILLTILFIAALGKMPDFYSAIIVFSIMVVDIFDGLIFRYLRPCDNKSHRIWDSFVDKIVIIAIILAVISTKGLTVPVAIILFLQTSLLIVGVKIRKAFEPHYLQKFALGVVGIAGIAFLMEWHVNFLCWLACYCYGFSIFYYSLRLFKNK